MKLTIQQQDLLPHIQAVSRSIGVKATLPVLANVLLQTGQGKLKLSATNLELGIIKLVGANILEDGEITVPGRTFLEIVSSLGGEELILESQSDQLKIMTKSFQSVINGISAVEFPAIPLSSEKSILVDSGLLFSSLPQITFSAASDEGRPILTGILTEIKNGSIEFVATDGFKLAHKSIILPVEEKSNNESMRLIVPRRTFEEIVRIIQEELKGESEKVSVATSENQNQIIFEIGNTKLSSRLIEGQFPSWEKIVPKSFINRVVLEKEVILKAIKIASVFSKSNSNIIKLKTAAGKIHISSETKEVGSQENEVDAQTEGEEVNIAFNGKFIADILSAVGSSQVSIEFSGNLSPALIKPVGEEGLEYVVMPIRLS